MSLLTELVAGLAPTIRGLAGDFGAQVTVYRVVETSAPDGGVARTYAAPDPSLTDIPCFLHAARASVPEASSRPYGIAVGGIGSASLPALASTGALPMLNVLDGVKVLTGPFAGYTYLCEAESESDAAGTFALVKLIAAPAGVLP